MNIQKWFMTTIIVSLVIMLGACGANGEVDEKFSEIEQEITVGLDEEMTREVLGNDKVETGYVQDVDGTAKAVLVFKEDVSEEEKAEIMNEYSDKLMEKYPDRNINVIVNELE